MNFQGTTRTDPYGRSLAHTALISDDWRRSDQELALRTPASPCDTRAPLCVGRVLD